MRKWKVRKLNGVWCAGRAGDWPRGFPSWRAAIAAVLIAEACRAEG